MKTVTTSIIATLALTLAGTAFAGVNPHEQNRQIQQLTRGLDTAQVQVASAEGSKVTAQVINRDITTASQREALLNKKSERFEKEVAQKGARAENPFQRNRNS